MISLVILCLSFPFGRTRSWKTTAGPAGPNRRSRIRVFPITRTRCVLDLRRYIIYPVNVSERRGKCVSDGVFLQGRDERAEARVVKKKTILPFSSGGRDRTEKQNGVQRDKRDDGHGGEGQKLLSSQSHCKHFDLWINSSYMFYFSSCCFFSCKYCRHWYYCNVFKQLNKMFWNIPKLNKRAILCV